MHLEIVSALSGKALRALSNGASDSNAQVGQEVSLHVCTAVLAGLWVVARQLLVAALQRTPCVFLCHFVHEFVGPRISSH